MEVNTQPGRKDLYLTLPPQINVNKQEAGATKRLRLSILPASLGLFESLDFVKATPELCESHAVVFTGTLVNIAEQLEHLTLFVNTSEQMVDGLAHNFANAAKTSADASLAAFVAHPANFTALPVAFLRISKDFLLIIGLSKCFTTMVWGRGLPDVKRQVKKQLYSAFSAGSLAQPLFLSVARELETGCTRNMCGPCAFLRIPQSWGPKKFFATKQAGKLDMMW